MEIHFVYAGGYYWYDDEHRLRSFILKGMKKNNIKKVMVTSIRMSRYRLITKERMENFCNGKEDEKDSVNDDLENLFNDIQLGKKPDDNLGIYYLPKLTKEELDLVERKDEDFMNTFGLGMNADVDKAEMLLSESDSKFVLGDCWRHTYTVEKSLSETRTEE